MAAAERVVATNVKEAGTQVRAVYPSFAHRKHVACCVGREEVSCDAAVENRGDVRDKLRGAVGDALRRDATFVIGDTTMWHLEVRLCLIHTGGER